MATLHPRTRGRSILLGEEKLHVRGVTYGTFRFSDGSSFPAAKVVEGDFETMAEVGVNAIRTYEPPPLWLLDAAWERGIHVMAGVAWEQHVAFLDDPECGRRIAADVRAQVAGCVDHPAILCYAVGNEIPAPIVRWHGKRAIESFIERLYWSAKEASPEGLVTYVNYPSTEYLELPFLDLAAFNVFLEDEARFESYLARLQNICGDRPLLVAETGLDSRRHGEAAQARALEWQMRHAFGAGAAGLFVFSWTDEWHRGGEDVLDWDFGVVDRGRRPKQSLAAIREAFAAVPFSPGGPWPRVSVVVCTHNGESTLPECLDRLSTLSYPDYEVIVVCDGSSDRSAQIAREFGAVLVETEHRGLSHARNAGIATASGEIVAFLDDDAYPDSDWLRYVAAALATGEYAGVGGPNIPPADDGWVAECVAAAPGGPIHVLVSDREAEHVPGCNMAFRKSELEAIGCFDERFRVAGDDVDVCWRLQEAGRRLGFSAGAVVMHRRRDSVRRYLKQQYGYGKAEALLERKWPSRYNGTGSSRWAGRIYHSPLAWAVRRRAMIRYGTWGSGLFQSIYEPAPGTLSSLLVAPEFLLVILALGAISALGLAWAPLLLALPLFAGALICTSWRALVLGWSAHRAVPGRSRAETLMRRAVTVALFTLQPYARLAGRLRRGLSPWRRRLRPRAAWPRPRTVKVWSECWRAPQAWLQLLQDGFAASGGLVRSGGPFDRWDLDLRAGPLGGVRIRTVLEEHGSGCQLMRARIWPRGSIAAAVAVALIAAAAIAAMLGGESAIGIVLAVLGVTVVALGIESSATSMRLALTQLAGAAVAGGRPAAAEPERPAVPEATRLRPATREAAEADHGAVPEPVAPPLEAVAMRSGLGGGR